MENGTKAVEFDQADVERRSVIINPDVPDSKNPVPSYSTNSIWWTTNSTIDEVPAFGVGKQRDIFLRNFITKDNLFLSALGLICSRNAGFSWKIDGPPRTAERLRDVLDTANFGKGWHDLILKTCVDLYTQDDGAFWEVVRAEDSPSSPLIGINHLDSGRCYHTGAPEAPVIYIDNLGRGHLLPWYGVITFADMPVTLERFYGKQYSAITRLIQQIKITRNYNTLDEEKSSGRETHIIHLVKGITTQQLQDAINGAQATADGRGFTRYVSPVVVGTLDPKADVGVASIELASKPKDFDPEVAMKHYILQVAMAFMSDYQEFAPLPGGGLGTGRQSETLHLKSQGKGPALFMKLVEHALNFRIFPKNAKFTYTELDVQAEQAMADVKAVRAQTRSVRIASGEITPQVARQMANDEGDLPQELLNLMGEMDVTTDVTVRESDPAIQTLNQEIPANAQAAPNNVVVSQPRAPVISAPTPLGPKQR